MIAAPFLGQVGLGEAKREQVIERFGEYISTVLEDEQWKLGKL